MIRLSPSVALDRLLDHSPRDRPGQAVELPPPGEPTSGAAAVDRGPVATIAHAIRDAAAPLLPIADNPRLEARLLIPPALGLTPNDLIRDPHPNLEPEHLDRLR